MICLGQVGYAALKSAPSAACFGSCIEQLGAIWVEYAILHKMLF